MARRGLWASLIFGAFLISASAGGSVGAVRPRLDPQSRILAFGDSLTDGVGGAGENYPRYLSRLTGLEVINAGLPGETTSQGLRRLPGVLSREHPALLILCLGINDLLQGVDGAIIRENLLAMVRLASDAGVPVLILALPLARTAQSHPLFDASFTRAGAWLDTDAMVRVLSNPGLKADLVHPNREGYRAVAAAVDARLRREGVLPEP